MKIAIEEATKSKSREYDPMVGAAIARSGQLIEKAFRGERGEGMHAEASALDKIGSTSRNDSAIGSTVFTTLEPCTVRTRQRWPCANLLISKRVKRVVFGMLDPNKDIRGQGYWQLEEAGIEIGKFDSDLVHEIRSLNGKFIDYETGLGISISNPKPGDPIKRGRIEFSGTYRMRPRAGDRIVALVRQRILYAPQQPISFDRDSPTWKCGVWCTGDEKDGNEYELIVARINDDLQISFLHYSRVHGLTNKWIPIEMPIVPTGLEILASVQITTS